MVGAGHSGRQEDGVSNESGAGTGSGFVLVSTEEAGAITTVCGMHE